MTSVPVVRGEEEVGENLPAAGVGLVCKVEAAACGVGIDEVGKRSVGSELRVVFSVGESGFEELASGEIVLIFEAAEVGGFDILRIRQLRHLRGEEGVLVVQEIHQKTGSENVAAGEVGLEFGEIADAPGVIIVLADGERGINGIGVIAFEGVVEPDSSLFDGAGEGEAGKELVESPSVLILDGRNEVGGKEAEVIVADAGVELKNAAGSFAVFGGFARGLDLNGAKGIGADADDEFSVGGLGDIEAVEQGDGLVSLSSSNVGLAGLILNDARDKVQCVAIVVGAGVDDVDDVESADGFLRDDLRGIDGGRRFMDIDDFVDFLLVRDGNIDGQAGPDLNAGLIESVEALFFDAELVFSGGEGRELAASGEVGLAAERGRGRRLQ